MWRSKNSKEIVASQISCLENFVVAYNTVFIMSSIFIVLIAATARDLFSDISRVLSPSLLLLIVGSFIVLVGTLGYVGVGKKSSSLISMYTMLLIFIFVMEISAGLGVLSFRREIRSLVTHKMKKAISVYPTDPMTANMIDYVQLKLQCCGINSFTDWEEVSESIYPTRCKINEMNLPQSCCTGDSVLQIVNKRGCLPAVDFMLHRSSLGLATAIIAICTLHMSGAYLSYTLASSLSKYKIQKMESSQNQAPPPPYEAEVPVNHNEKSNYF